MYVQGSTIRPFPGLVNFDPADAYPDLAMNRSKLLFTLCVFVVVLAASTKALDGPLNNNGFWRSVSDGLDSALGQDYSSNSKTR